MCVVVVVAGDDDDDVNDNKDDYDCECDCDDDDDDDDTEEKRVWWGGAGMGLGWRWWQLNDDNNLLAAGGFGHFVLQGQSLSVCQQNIRCPLGLKDNAWNEVGCHLMSIINRRLQGDSWSPEADWTPQHKRLLKHVKTDRVNQLGRSYWTWWRLDMTCCPSYWSFARKI